MKCIIGRFYADADGEMYTDHNDESRLKTFVRLGTGNWWDVHELRNMLTRKYGADHISDVKINSELIDSWTSFGINNFKDVDDYGPINKIINDRDEVFFFQDKAVGQYSINPRAITSTEDGIPTELGSAEGLQDFKYLTNRHGAMHQ